MVGWSDVCAFDGCVCVMCCLFVGGMLFAIHRFLCVYVVDCVLDGWRLACLCDRYVCLLHCLLFGWLVVCPFGCRYCVCLRFVGLSVGCVCV